MPSEGLFRLPEHRREALLNPFSPVNTKAKYVALMGRTEPEILEYMDSDCDKGMVLYLLLSTQVSSFVAMQTCLPSTVMQDRQRGLKIQIPAVVGDVPGLHDMLGTSLNSPMSQHH